MQFTPSILTSLLKVVDRRRFRESVARHGADAYGKKFNSWEHLVALVYAQLSGASSLRALETGFNSQSNHHYHLGCGPLSRSTLADANRRRPVSVFADVFHSLIAQLDRKARREAKAVLQLIDSTPVMLSDMFDCATSNGRIRGLKLHVLHDLESNCPHHAVITPATVNDIIPARAMKLTKGVTYVFDKAYCDFDWWTKINKIGAFFVTRPKTNMAVKVLATRPLETTQGDGFTVLSDCIVARSVWGKSKLDMPLRRIRIRRDCIRTGSKTGSQAQLKNETFDIISNDLQRPAHELATSYKARWQIELLFRWIKQNLNIKKFISFNENALRLQIIAAMIAYVLIRIAQVQSRSLLPPRRFIELVRSHIHARRHIARIDKPPPINPSSPKTKCNPNQYELNLA
jgi:putative transposase